MPESPPERSTAPLDVNKAVELRLVRGLTYQEIADKLGVPKTTVFDRVSKILGLLDNPELNKSYANNRVEALNAAERVIFANLTDPAKLEKASLNNVAYAFQQIHNARRLEAGLATENVDIHGQYEAYIRRREAKASAISAIEERLAELDNSQENHKLVTSNSQGIDHTHSEGEG